MRAAHEPSVRTTDLTDTPHMITDAFALRHIGPRGTARHRCPRLKVITVHRKDRQRTLLQGLRAARQLPLHREVTLIVGCGFG